MTASSMTCPQCGSPELTELAWNRHRCNHCGSELVLSKDGLLQLITGRMCPKCGFDNEPLSAFCGQCGTSLLKTCPRCQSAFRRDLSFCPRCGANYEALQHEAEERERREEAERALQAESQRRLAEEEARLEENLRARQQVTSRMVRQTAIGVAILILLTAVGLFAAARIRTAHLTPPPDLVATRVSQLEAEAATMTAGAPTATPAPATVGAPVATYASVYADVATPRPTEPLHPWATNTPRPTETPRPTATNTVHPTDTPKPVPTSTKPPPTSTPTEAPAGAVKARERDGMQMAYVPAGNFIMGREYDDDERPVHTVFLDGYWIDKTEVTNGQYRLCAEVGACSAPMCDGGDGGYGDGDRANHPVACVSWSDAEAYCRWVGARLPTEAQWEKAARGTDGRTYPWGEAKLDCNRANYDDCAGFKSAPAGSYPGGASPYGALDVAGNLEEWVSDWFAGDYYSRSPARNPQGPKSGTERVVRGGSAGMFNVYCSFRFYSAPTRRSEYTGFRCATPP